MSPCFYIRGMNKKALLISLSLLMVVGAATAQGLYQIVINGTSSTTDDSGRIVTTPINNYTLIKELAQQTGVTDISSLSLAYHFQGSDMGDTIDVIDRNTGASVHTLFGLYFGESFGRMELISSSGRQMKRLEYIYTEQNSHSPGHALLTVYFVKDGNGNPNSVTRFGN